MTNWQVIEIQTLRFACKSRLQSADSMQFLTSRLFYLQLYCEDPVKQVHYQFDVVDDQWAIIRSLRPCVAIELTQIAGGQTVVGHRSLVRAALHILT